MPKFPMKSLEEFQQLESKLGDENSQMTKYMVSRLAAVGGSGLESHTRRILKFLITNEIACSFNWKRRNKIAFENTRIMAIIYEAAKLNFPVSERNDLVVANSVKDWLKYAKARLSEKKKSLNVS
ncbi:hypothetical protein NQ314_010951 [Rhamnusium bicolor]|uniref:DUF4806 domain-containing protein n=1 Tax=Rhamnusium bicolor TaxID=1586634 RepID=A0AAV8XM05_9CUCU|nr:hypothetical protein NQ314_010951 [Rhamnusium bicolor]